MALSSSQGETLPAAAAAEAALSKNERRMPGLIPNKVHAPAYTKSRVALSPKICKTMGVEPSNGFFCTTFVPPRVEDGCGWTLAKPWENMPGLWENMRACCEMERVEFKAFSTEACQVDFAAGWLLKNIPLPDKEVANLFVSEKTVWMGEDMYDSELSEEVYLLVAQEDADAWSKETGKAILTKSTVRVSKNEQLLRVLRPYEVLLYEYPINELRVALSPKIGEQMKFRGLEHRYKPVEYFYNSFVPESTVKDEYDNVNMVELWKALRACREKKKVEFEGFRTEDFAVDKVSGWLLYGIPLPDKKVVDVFVSEEMVSMRETIYDGSTVDLPVYLLVARDDANAWFKKTGQAELAEVSDERHDETRCCMHVTNKKRRMESAQPEASKKPESTVRVVAGLDVFEVPLLDNYDEFRNQVALAKKAHELNQHKISPYIKIKYFMYGDRKIQNQIAYDTIRTDCPACLLLVFTE